MNIPINNGSPEPSKGTSVGGANDLTPCYYFQHLFTALPKRTLTNNISELMSWNVEIGEIGEAE